MTQNIQICSFFKQLIDKRKHIINLHTSQKCVILLITNIFHPQIINSLFSVEEDLVIIFKKDCVPLEHILIY